MVSSRYRVASSWEERVKYARYAPARPKGAVIEDAVLRNASKGSVLVYKSLSWINVARNLLPLKGSLLKTFAASI